MECGTGICLKDAFLERPLTDSSDRCSYIGILGFANFLIISPFHLLFILSHQVLTLKDLSLNLGETYRVQWDLVMADYHRFDCYPEEDANETKCTARGCLWEVGGAHILSIFCFLTT